MAEKKWAQSKRTTMDIAHSKFTLVLSTTSLTVTRGGFYEDVELGNGDKFLFDIGTGAAERLAALQVPYNYMNNVFLGHLHADHMGDLPALWVGGTINNRTVPLEVWGPSGSEEQYRTKHAIKGLKDLYNWDIASGRSHREYR